MAQQSLAARLNPVGAWYRYLSELGESSLIRFAELDRSGKPVHWHSFSHEETDGVGGMLLLLRSAGSSPPVPQIHPDLRAHSIFRFPWARVCAWARMMNYPPRFHVPWKSFERAWRCHIPEGAPEPTARAWHLFSEEETGRLRAQAHKMGITLNTLLLWAAAQAFAPELMQASQEWKVLWMLPVNLRGAVRRDHESDNHSSLVPITVHSTDNAKILHARILKERKMDFHWAAWKVASRMPRFSDRMARAKVIRDYLRPGHPWFGSFSNLGTWEGPENASGYAFFPTITKVRPFAVAALTYNGRLCFSLQAHPALSQSRESAERWIALWREKLT